MPIRDIKNHLERADARIVRDAQLEAIEERKRFFRLVIKIKVAVISVLCVIYAIYQQF